MSDSNISPATKKLVAERALYRCEYCQSQARYSPDPFSIEHIFPLARGGKSSIENYAFSCQGCNNHKHISVAGIDPVSGENVRLFHPRQEQWDDHFTWIDQYSKILGLTAIGRATVEKLRLNREGVVNLRTVLRELGKHP